MYHEPANALDTMGVVNDECHSASVDKAVGDRAIGDTATGDTATGDQAEQGGHWRDPASRWREPEREQGCERAEERTAAMSGNAMATAAASTDTDTSAHRAGWSALRLETPVLRFADVPAGFSQSHPIQVVSAAKVAIDLEVISPPLAPFSVVHMAREGRSTSSAKGSSAKIWIRYDAASPMAADSGRITVGDRVTGQQWTVALDGRGSLAPQYSAR